MALVFQVGFNPLFNSGASLILRIEANAETLVGLAPTHRSSNPDAWESQQCKGYFHGSAGGDVFLAPHGHATRAQLMTGRDEPSILRGHKRDFSHDWNPNVSPELMQHQSLRGTHQLQSCRALQGLVENSIDPIFRESHGFLCASAKPVDDHPAV